MSRYIWDKVNKQKVLVAGSGDESVSEIIANTEGLTSSHVYTVGNLLIHNNKLFVVTKAIAINDVLDATPTTGNIEESGTIVDEISSLKQTLETAIDDKQGKTLTTAQTIGGTSRTTVEAALGALADSEYLVDNLTSSSAVKALTANQGLQLANKHKVTRKTVDTSSWTADTSSQSGTTLYKKSISLSHVYVDSPSVDISTSSGTGLPTTAQQTDYDLLQYVTVDGTTMYLYASDIPSTTFYIGIEGVD